MSLGRISLVLGFGILLFLPCASGVRGQDWVWEHVEEVTGGGGITALDVYLTDDEPPEEHLLLVTDQGGVFYSYDAGESFSEYTLNSYITDTHAAAVVPTTSGRLVVGSRNGIWEVDMSELQDPEPWDRTLKRNDLQQLQSSWECLGLDVWAFQNDFVIYALAVVPEYGAEIRIYRSQTPGSILLVGTFPMGAFVMIAPSSRMEAATELPSWQQTLVSISELTFL